jgi:hypothetical protein
LSRRSKFATAAEEWLQRNAKGKTVTTDDLWQGLISQHPELTTSTEQRKTPRTTCMRDLRKDPGFVVGDRKVRLAG